MTCTLASNLNSHTAAFPCVQRRNEAVLRADKELGRLARQPSERLHVRARRPAQRLPIRRPNVRLQRHHRMVTAGIQGQVNGSSHLAGSVTSSGAVKCAISAFRRDGTLLRC